MMPRRASIRTRLTLVYGATFLAVTTALVLVTYLLVRHSMYEAFRRLNLVDLKDKSGAALPPGKVIMIGEDGTPVTLADLKSRITVEQQQALESTTQSLLNISVATAIIGGLVTLAVCWLMSGRVIRPLQVINSMADSIVHSSLHRRIRLAGPQDELKRLADTFDAMLERLDRSFDSQRRFVGNAAHELRTPLAVSRALIQVALGRAGAPAELRELGATLLEINTRQSRLTESLLILARSEQDLADAGPVDLAAVSAEVGGRLAERADRAGVELIMDVEPVVVPGDPVLLSQLIDNLISNAIAYNHPGGHVALTVATVAEGCRLTVENTGDPIDPAAVPDLFEPFRRLGPQRTAQDGVGLGLSIVRSIAHAHHGRVSATAREGGGLVVDVRLPVAGA